MSITNDEKFQLLTGVKRKTFFIMLEILTGEYEKIHTQGGNKGIGPGCRLILALTYWREYRVMRQIAFDYDLSVSSVCNGIKWVELTLSKNDLFKLADIKTEIEKLEAQGIKINTIIGDVEEQPIERPILNQEDDYSGKKKMHTTKNQIIIDENSLKIINVSNSNGKTHDFKILEESNVCGVLKDLGISGKFDSGYQGVQKLMEAIIPYKKSKNHELTDDEKKYNTTLSKTRIKIEHTNRKIKIFRIMKERYRNHKNRYELKLFIMVGIYNLNLDA